MEALVEGVARAEAVAELRRIYAAAEEDARRNQTLVCGLSGRCCRFREAGQDLFLTRLEYEEMVARGGPPARGAGAACPWLRGNLCDNREGRALACRTYFCSDEAAAAALTERWHREIRLLHERLGLPYEYRSITGFAGVPARHPRTSAAAAASERLRGTSRSPSSPSACSGPGHSPRGSSSIG